MKRKDKKENYVKVDLFEDFTVEEIDNIIRELWMIWGRRFKGA